MRRVVLLFLLAPLVVFAAACGGGGQSGQTESQPSPSVVEQARPTPAPQAGLILTRFVEAAGAADSMAMWALLSSETQQRLGPTVEDFARALGPKFQGGLGSFAGTDYKLVLAVEMPSGWGVAAIAGTRERDGQQEFATYAAALRREGEEWKIELGAPLDLIRVSPKEVQTSDAQPQIAIRLKADTAIDGAGLWLDGEPLPAQGRTTDGREVLLVAKPGAPLGQGNHVVVAFGQSGDTANAGSTPVEVQGQASQSTSA